MSRDQTLPLPLFAPWQPVAAERRAGSVPCVECGWQALCGGPAQERPDASQPEMWGCFGQCDLECRDGSCDWTCPNNPARWLRRWAEVGGIGTAARFGGTLRAVDGEQLPLYAPVIGHGKRRERPACVGTAVVPLYEVVGGKRGGGYGLHWRADTGGLRAEFRLRADCRVLLLSVGPDERLERFWQQHRAADLPRVLADLGLTGVTAPNFSFFTDAPRTHSLWNRARTLRVAERLSAAGVAVRRATQQMDVVAVATQPFDFHAVTLLDAVGHFPHDGDDLVSPQRPTILERKDQVIVNLVRTVKTFLHGHPGSMGWKPAVASLRFGTLRQDRRELSNSMKATPGLWYALPEPNWRIISSQLRADRVLRRVHDGVPDAVNVERVVGRGRGFWSGIVGAAGRGNGNQTARNAGEREAQGG